MPSTYNLISSYTFPDSSASSTTFSAIPSTYTDLVLVVHAQCSASAYPYIRFNGSSSGYYLQYFYGNTVTSTVGSGFTSGGYSNVSEGYLSNALGGMTTSSFTWGSITFINSYLTSGYKTFSTHAGTGNSSGGVELSTGAWHNTSAITSILVGAASGTFTQGTVASLYGVYGG
jgi:hypothetical protein